MIPGTFALAASSPLPTLAYQSRDGQFPGTGTGTFTFTGMAIGTASATRIVIVPVGYLTTDATITATATIGGISAAEISGCVAKSAASGTALVTRMYTATVPTGTTATVVVTFTGAGARGCSIGVWSSYDLLSATPVASAGVNATGTNANDVSVNVSANGVVVGYVIRNVNITWSGATEVFDASEGTLIHSGADYSAGAAETPRTITSTPASSSAGPACAASFR